MKLYSFVGCATVMIGVATAMLRPGQPERPAAWDTWTHQPAEYGPWIPLSSETTPGDKDALYKITEPGCYYLPGDVTGEPGKLGIEIAAGYVVVDLMGHLLAGTPDSRDGIRVTRHTARRIVIRDGVVRGWGGDGIGGVNGSSVIDCTSRDNTGAGIRVGDFGVVANCHAIENGAAGIHAGDASRVEGNFSARNAGYGIRTGADCLVRRNACAGGPIAGNIFGRNSVNWCSFGADSR